MKNSSTPELSHDEIAERARTIWKQSGRLDGRDLEHWLQAESELRKERQTTASATKSHTSAAGHKSR